MLRYPPSSWTNVAATEWRVNTVSSTDSVSEQYFSGNSYGNGTYKLISSKQHGYVPVNNTIAVEYYGIHMLLNRNYGQAIHLVGSLGEDRYFKIEFPRPICIKKILLRSRFLGQVGDFTATQHDIDNSYLMHPKSISLYHTNHSDANNEIHMKYGNGSEFDFVHVNNTQSFIRTLICDNDNFYTTYIWKHDHKNVSYSILGELEIYGYEEEYENIVTSSIITNDLTTSDASALKITASDIIVDRNDDKPLTLTLKGGTNTQKTKIVLTDRNIGNPSSGKSQGHGGYIYGLHNPGIDHGLFLGSISHGEEDAPALQIKQNMVNIKDHLNFGSGTHIIQARELASNYGSLYLRAGYYEQTNTNTFPEIRIIGYTNGQTHNTDNCIALRTNNKDGIFINQLGVVGIGTSTPATSSYDTHPTHRPVLDVHGHIYCHNYVFAQYLNMSHNTETRDTDGVFYSSGDSFIRKNDASGMRSSLSVPTRTGGDASGTWNIDITGESAFTGVVKSYGRMNDGSRFSAGGGRMYYYGHDRYDASPIYTYFGTMSSEPGYFTNRNNYGYIGRSDHKFYKLYCNNIYGNLYAPFTGVHLNKIKPNKMKDEGMIVVIDPEGKHYSSDYSTTGIDAIKIHEALPSLKISNKAYDKSIFGVLSKQESDSTLYKVNGLGEGAIWVSDMNGPIESGDYITSSDLIGYGMKQDEEQMMNYTVAKITMYCDFEAELEPKLKIKKHAIMSNVKAFEEVEKVETTTIVEFDEILGLYLNKTSNYTVKEKKKLFDEFPIYEYRDIPLYSNQIVGTSNIYDNSNVVVGTSNVYSNVVIGTSNMLVNTSNVHKVRRYSNMEIEENVLDSNGELIWEPELDSNGDMIMQPAYKMRYLNSNSDIITLDDYLEAKSNNVHVYRAAFVGCTYHCS